MRVIGDILKNHPVPGIRFSEARLTIAKAASALVKMPIDPKQVKYKGTIAFFSVPPVIKTELLLRADDLKKVLAGAGVALTDLK